MRISKRSQYGLRALFRLAESDGYSPLRTIAKREEISFDYLEKILSQLERGGMVNSKRGVSGGYSLARSPAEIDLKSILEILETKFSLVECIDIECDRKGSCPTASIWMFLDSALKDALKSITLEDLIKMHGKKSISG